MTSSADPQERGGATVPEQWYLDLLAQLAERDAELQAMRGVVEKGKQLVEEMDQRMPEQATEDADGWIISYRIPVGPWHRLLGWARGGLIVTLDQAQRPHHAVDAHTEGNNAL